MSEEKPIIDAHSHATEYPRQELEYYKEKNIIIVAVADDLETSLKTLQLHKEYENIQPCIGIHPWNIGKTPSTHLDEIDKLVSRMKNPCIGEVGLDTMFVPETIQRQREFFNKILKTAREYNAVLNLHTPGTWNEVYNLLVKNDINKAMFHWYTGPTQLISLIQETGYYISINAAAKIQKKHQKTIEETNLKYMLTESDGPYKYRGIRLNPLMINDLLSIISLIKDTSIHNVRKQIYNNYTSLFLSVK